MQLREPVSINSTQTDFVWGEASGQYCTKNTYVFIFFLNWMLLLLKHPVDTHLLIAK